MKRTYKQKDMTAIPSKYPQGYFKEKPCRWCKENFKPIAPSHLFCSDWCKDRSCSNSYYLAKYKMNLSEVEKMLEQQDYLCAICKQSGFKMHEGVWTMLNVDHCHTSGTVRGALCHNCNRGLGLFKDSVSNLKSVISYLEGVTTIPEGSTYKCTEAHDTHKE